MKKIYLLTLALAICSTTFAQNFLGMKIKKFGISTTIDQDRVEGLDAAYFSNLSKSGLNSNIANQDFPDEAIESMICENPTVRAEITVLPFKVQPNFQLNLGTSLMFNRIEATEYNFWRGSNSGGYNNISFDSYSHEAALDASLVYHQKLAFLNFYGGVGSNLGYTFAGHMNIQGSYENEGTIIRNPEDGGPIVTDSEFVNFSEYHQMKNSIQQRAFLQGGVSVIFFKRLELGFEARRGVGYRYNTGNPLKFTNLFSSGLSLKWNLK